MENDTYKTIEGISKGFFSEKGSKFYAFAYNVENEQQVKERISELKKTYFDAKHLVYAFIIGVEKKIFRYSDDGEPANSSGTPVFGQIRSSNLTNILVVVIRYFGGTKLGIPGLINAYKSATFQALSEATIVEKTVNVFFSLVFSYEKLNFVQNTIQFFKAEIVKQNFETNCSFIIKVRKSLENIFFQEFLKNDKIKIEYVEEICKINT
ncbi:MAG: YigZ family protein [Bacteroidales bacterium]|jgi:uncharacterized YigZ family protein|nr:YigZ family protein [Bacteroidales bacterium]